jgi:type II secretory pathway pseudopilin PulG
MKRASRPAVTLFQLLIVLALLLILFAMLLPAIAKARLEAVRMQSANNLKQLGLACHNYHDVHGKFCPGHDDNHFSATARLLPYIEQDALFKTIDFKKSIDDKANAPARGTTIKVLINPTDPVKSVTTDYGPTNYLFNAGSKYALKDNDGLFYHNSGIRFADVLDGTSNTVMAVETLKGDSGVKAMDVKRQHILLKKDALAKLGPESGVKEFKEDKKVAADRGASWMDGRHLMGTFTGTRRVNDPRPDVSCAGMGGLSGPRSLQNTAYVLWADGSVRPISQKVTPALWKLMTDRKDGMPLRLGE